MLRYLLVPTVACVALLSLGAHGVRAAAPGPIEPSVWQHHQTSTSYFGLTSVYTCSGIEQAVRSLLLYFGARSDLNVTASCPDAVRPVRTALIHSDFYSLRPTAPHADGSVSAQWVPVHLRPQLPASGSSSCELVQQFKSLLTQNFSLRTVSYQADCMPNSFSLQDYSVRAQVLKPVGVR